MTTNLASFFPPFCPWPQCPQHLAPGPFRWVRFGSYTRRCEPRVIPRYRCGHCRRTFSAQTFSTTYYLKRPELLLEIFQRLVACSGYRQIARGVACHPSTVMGQAARLGRHSLLVLHEDRPRCGPREPLVIDGFESFAYSQYHPLHLNLAVGARSHYVYAFTQTELRRKGRMRASQRRRREWIESTYGRAEPSALERDVAELIEIAAPIPRELTVRSDEHASYPRAFRRLRGRPIRHERTPSVQARTPSNPLFPVNLLDLLLRHCSANHKRETIAFSKRHQSVLERAAVLFLWRNFSKAFSENHGGGTPAMRIGIRSGPVSPKGLLQGRRFPARVRLPARWHHYYLRGIPTPRILNPRRHALVHAS